ncbi:signal peptide peptidase SppA [Erythrobacteraceae bacterium WH01K]|nr:signal peptide peptidase SppA [Erythrobacteraceae bacterium WH01K]
MAFAKSVWRLLVGVKDALVLVLLLLFFFALYGVLTARPSPAQVTEGALLVELNGYVVEEKTPVDPFDALLSGTAPVGEYDVQDVVHALDTAATDERISSVVLDLSGFLGGGQAHLQDIGAALDRVRVAEKPVLTYAVAYADDGMMLASHASEVWLDPLGGAFIAGPGGERLYYAGLLEQLNINARVYRVGTYKSAVEPYLETGMSEPARENYTSLYEALWEEWQAHVKKARPRTDIARVTADPAAWVEASSGDLATAALQAGLVDKLGNKVEFGQRVAEISGEDPYGDAPGSYAYSGLDPWLADNPRDTGGSAIGVVTIAGEIVDGEAGPGTAGGDRIATLLDDALEDDLAGLVVRVDSPGGSVLASELIREAILRHKARDIPVAVSMANVAASGGYWVSTPADRIFAEPETITGSIGIFAVIPTFEDLAAEYGVNSDGVRTTPLSGQPDLIGGFTPEVDSILQSSISDGYTDFIRLVATSRNLSEEQADRIGQGRVWDGGTARQIGLVDQYGGLDEAAEWVAAQAGVVDDGWHLTFLGDGEATYDTLLRSLVMPEAAQAVPQDVFALMANRQAGTLDRLEADASRLLTTRGMQAYCLECPTPPARVTLLAAAGSRPGFWQKLAALLD